MAAPDGEPPREGGGASSTAGCSRQELKLRVFQWCDRDGDGLLKLEEMFELARMVGFEGTDAEWREEFKRLCQERGATEAGIPAETVLQLLDDESDSGCFCTDEELGMLCTACGAAPAAEAQATAAASASSTADSAVGAAAAADPDTGANVTASGSSGNTSAGAGDRTAADPKDADPEVPTTPPATAGLLEANAAVEAAKDLEEKEDASLPLAKPSEDGAEAAAPVEEDPVRSADFSRWLESTELPADTVELKLDEDKVTAHAFILAARCGAFRTLLTDVGRSISLAGVRRAPLMQVLRYLYSGGTVELAGEDAAEVFELAVRFELPGLRTLSLAQLMKSVEVENVLGLFTLSERYQTHLKQLKERCVEVIQDNLETVCSSPNFQDFCRNPEQVRSLFLATASEPPQKRRRKVASLP
mmetsp:Transcript_39193/g.90893  ORF Transcript_39193/g.90893 Transcript_39193/m.90893 type:complete len:417 (-) Transcript_39193:71-1321(-)